MDTFINYKIYFFLGSKILIRGCPVGLSAGDISIRHYLVFCLFNHSSKAVKYAEFQLRAVLATDVVMCMHELRLSIMESVNTASIYEAERY